MTQFIRERWTARSGAWKLSMALGMVLAILTVTAVIRIFAVDADHDQWEDSGDATVPSRAWLDFGDPTNTVGDYLNATAPSWWVYTYKVDGEWVTSGDTSWHVPASTTQGVGKLIVEVDRSYLTNDAVLDLNLLDSTGASLYVDLIDTNAQIVAGASNLVGNLIKGTLSGTRKASVSLPFSQHPTAVGVQLRRGTGEVSVLDGLLYVDQDYDHLDADQEAQLGTSDTAADSDGDGYFDATEHNLGFDPLDSASRPYTNWSYSMPLSIMTPPADPLENMPVLVVLNSSRIDYSQFKAGGADIRFDDPHGVELDYEIARWDSNGTSHVWVRVPEISDTLYGNHFRMHWGNASATDAQNAAGVWTNGFTGVWHMEEPVGTVKDSTVGGYDGLNEGSVQAAGKVGLSRDFFRNGSILLPPAAFSTIDKEVTLSFWQYMPPERGITYQEMLLEAGNLAGDEFLIALPYSSYVYWQAFGNIDTVTRSISASVYKGVWNHWAFTKNSATGVMDIYLNGQLWQHGTGKTRTYSPVTTFRLGSWVGGSQNYPGMVDEFSVSPLVRSADWIAAQYATMNDTYLLYGSEKVGILAGQNGSEAGGGTNGTFVVYRENAFTNAAVTVNYIASGTAVADVDYTNLSGYAVIDAGATQSVINVNVIPSAREQGAMSLTLTLVPGIYGIDPAAPSATIRIDDGALDTDGDGIPDTWESSNGLNPTNALDAQLDTDGDGVLNIDEYTLGLDPNVAVTDSDSDTLTDAEEIYVFGTSPFLTDSDTNGVGDASVIFDWAGAETVHRSGLWAENGSVVYSLTNRLARLEYQGSVAGPAMYRLGLQITNAAAATSTKTFKLQLLVDGTPFKWLSIPVQTNSTAWGYATTPWLGAGDHTFRLAWLDDYGAAKQLGVVSLVLQKLDAPDADENSRQDWMDASLGLGLDTDADGLTDLQEVDETGTSVVKADSDAGLLHCNWDFDDGGNSTAQNPSHTFASAGTYDVVVTASDGQGGTVSNTITVTATSPAWKDGFEAYASGSQIHGQGGWKGWDNSSSCGAYVSNNVVRTGSHSLEIKTVSDLVHEYSGATNGTWTYMLQQYVPTNFSGRSYFIMLNRYSDGGSKVWSVQVYFDSASGKVHSDFDAHELTLVKGQWVPIRVVIDLEADSQTFYYNGQALYTKSWKSGVSGTGDKAIRAVDLFANSASVVYYDDISLRAGGAGANLPPQAQDQVIVTAKDQGKRIVLSATDPDENSLSYSIAANPSNGTLHAVSGSEVIYTPTAGFTGADSFTFTASDGTTNSTAGTVSIVVLPSDSAAAVTAAAIPCSGEAPLTVQFSAVGSGTGMNGDTLSDGEEISIFITDPLDPDSDDDGINDAYPVSAHTGVDTVAREVWHSADVWLEEGDTLYQNGVYTASRAIYEFTLTNAGMYRAALSMRNHGYDLPDNFHYAINLAVDEQYIDTFDVMPDVDVTGTGYITLPWLEPGTYRLALRKSNNGYYYSGRALWPAYEKIEILAVDSIDANTNGVPDHAENRLRERGDSDGDGLTDYDEVMTYHSNPLSIDSDGDGMTDGDEVAAGTDPTVIDTDGDGMGDGWEQIVGSNPFTADYTNLSSPVAVISVIPSQTNAVEGTWEVVDTNSIQCVSRRGSVSYELNVTTPFMYALAVTGSQGYEYSDVATFRVLAYVDGQYVGAETISVNGAGKGYFITPWLTAGSHSLKLFWDGIYNNCALRITAITLTAYDGPDANGNGLADWIDNRLTTFYSVETSGSGASSPLCVEGKGRFLSSMSATADGSPVTLKNGAGHRWYADVPLSAAGATEFVLSVESGIKTITNSIAWQSVNILSASDLALRKGDSLLLTAAPAGATNGTVVVDVAGVTNYVTDVATPVEHAFDTNGVFTVAGIHDNGTVTSNAIDVNVVAAAFTTNAPAVWWGKSRLYEIPGVPAADVEIEYDDLTFLSRLTVMTNGGLSCYVGVMDADDAHHLLARLNGGGSICDSIKIDACWILGDPGYYFQQIETLPDGTVVSETHIVVGYLPADCTIRIALLTGGSTFENGATSIYVTAADLDETGVYTYRMYTPPGASLMCHRVYLMEGSTYIGVGTTD